jgi:hypothetical protein
MVYSGQDKSLDGLDYKFAGSLVDSQEADERLIVFSGKQRFITPVIGQKISQGHGFINGQNNLCLTVVGGNLHDKFTAAATGGEDLTILLYRNYCRNFGFSGSDHGADGIMFGAKPHAA